MIYIIYKLFSQLGVPDEHGSFGLFGLIIQTSDIA